MATRRRSRAICLDHLARGRGLRAGQRRGPRRAGLRADRRRPPGRSTSGSGRSCKVEPEARRIVADIAAYQVTDPDRPTSTSRRTRPTRTRTGSPRSSTAGSSSPTPAGNDLLLVKPNGHVETVARFPNEVIRTNSLPPVLSASRPRTRRFPAEAVPTSVAVGPDGYWYVGELKGFPFTAGHLADLAGRPVGARRDLRRDAPRAGSASLFMDGFTSVVGHRLARQEPVRRRDGQDRRGELLRRGRLGRRTAGRSSTGRRPSSCRVD